LTPSSTAPLSATSRMPIASAASKLDSSWS
jgi:hypothetical protein